MSTKFEIEKFDGTTSFALWQVRISAILSNQDVKDAIEARPKDLPDEDWKKMDERALSTIQLSLSDSTLQEILNEKTAAGAWKRLEEIYMQKSVTNRLRLKQRFHSFKMAENTSVKVHISDYTALLNDMERIGIKVDDEDKAMVLLCSLPKSYQGFKETMLYSKDSISFEDVKNNLLVKSNMDSDLSMAENGHQGVGLIVETGRQKGKNLTSSTHSNHKHKNLICNYCRKIGHIKANCFKLKNKQKADGASSGDANLAEIVDVL